MSLEINVYDKTGELFYTTKSLQDLEEHSFLFRPGDKAVIEGEIDGANIFHHKNEQPPKQQNKKDDNSIIRLNKIGKFSIQTDFIYDQPELVKEILKDLIIVKTERSCYAPKFDYIAYGDVFEQVSEEREPYSYCVRAVKRNGKLEFDRFTRND